MKITLKITLKTLALGAALLSASLLVSSDALAAPGSAKTAPLVCPVTFLPVGSPSLAVGKSVYKGKTYYFCTSNCKRLFDKNAAKYAKHAK